MIDELQGKIKPTESELIRAFSGFIYNYFLNSGRGPAYIMVKNVVGGSGASLTGSGKQVFS